MLHKPEPLASKYAEPFQHRSVVEAYRHAGELAGPESIWEALSALGAERIAQGVRAAENPAPVNYLAQHRIPLDITPTSNISLPLH